MKVYHSALQLKDEFGLCLNKQIGLLRSFHPKPKSDRPPYCDSLFLDSGAFSAWRSGKEIDVIEYRDYLLEHGDEYDVYAGLDVIGDGDASADNQAILDEVGLQAIPTFHFGDLETYLEQILEDATYIGLGGMVGKASTPDKLVQWLDRVFDVIPDDVKVHGFGMTNFKLATCYPWYSIDSTTAARAGRTGVLLSDWGQLRVSKAIRSRTGKTIDTEKKISELIEWIADYHDVDGDFSWDVISGNTPDCAQARIVLNVAYMEKELNKPTKKRRSKKRGLFN